MADLIALLATRPAGAHKKRASFLIERGPWAQTLSVPMEVLLFKGRQSRFQLYPLAAHREGGTLLGAMARRLVLMQLSDW